MDSLPKWFLDSPKDSRSTFEKKIKELIACEDKSKVCFKIEEFIKIFGFLNRSTFEAYLPEECTIVAEWLRVKDERIKKIIISSLKTLIETGEPNYEEIKDLYPLSILSTENIFHNLIQEVTFYLLSQPMLIQDGRKLGFYSVEIFRKALDFRHGKLMRAVHFIFDMTINKEKLEQTLSQIEVKFDFGNIIGSIGNLFQTNQSHFRRFLGLEDEQFLFKYAALRGDGLIMSYGHFLISWARKSIYGKSLLDLIEANFCFDKFLIKESDSTANANTSLQNSLINSTLYIFFTSKEKIILPAGEWKEALRQVFCESEQTRLEAMDYVDELKKESGIVPFPFVKLLTILDINFPDKTSIIYQFLHSALHFFCPLSLSVSSEPQDRFKQFYDMTLEERLRLDAYLVSMKDILKLEMIKFLGEEEIADISLVLEELDGALLVYYLEFFKAAVKAKGAINKAIERCEVVDKAIITGLNRYQNRLDKLLLEDPIGGQIIEQGSSEKKEVDQVVVVNTGHEKKEMEKHSEEEQFEDISLI